MRSVIFGIFIGISLSAHAGFEADFCAGTLLGARSQSLQPALEPGSRVVVDLDGLSPIVHKERFSFGRSFMVGWDANLFSFYRLLPNTGSPRLAPKYTLKAKADVTAYATDSRDLVVYTTPERLWIENHVDGHWVPFTEEFDISNRTSAGIDRLGVRYYPGKGSHDGYLLIAAANTLSQIFLWKLLDDDRDPDKQIQFIGMAMAGGAVQSITPIRYHAMSQNKKQEKVAVVAGVGTKVYVYHAEPNRMTGRLDLYYTSELQIDPDPVAKISTVAARAIPDAQGGERLLIAASTPTRLRILDYDGRRTSGALGGGAEYKSPQQLYSFGLNETCIDPLHHLEGVVHYSTGSARFSYRHRSVAGTTNSLGQQNIDVGNRVDYF